MDPIERQPVTKEIRFAVVMYGGVSLAVYMNGIAQELLHLVRSTARKGWEKDDESQFRFNESELKGTESVYRKLAQKLTGVEGQNGVRFIVDILSGTSAGGINGIFLAKALANGQGLDSLAQLWVQEGDLAKLLNDSASTRGMNLSRPSQPKSLLNSDRLYLKLLDAFTDMDLPKTEAPVPRQELVEELDLYVTTTDIRGRVVPLRTSDRLVYERRYKYAFHLAYARPEDSKTGTERNDFTLRHNPFLAFTARCTSSFPFAFEPMRLAKLEELLPRFTRYAYERDLGQWLKFFATSHKEDGDMEIKDRSFGDGGYLDNKPFGHAIDALMKRSNDLPSERKLLYIEPSPEHPELEAVLSAKAEREPPNAVENSVAALVTLPGYEPIREDLLRINERNRTIRKITELIDGVMGGLQNGARRERREKKDETPATEDDSKKKDGLKVAEMQEQQGASYAGYIMLRAFDVTDQVANVIARASNIERESSYFYALRCIVRVWREMFYEQDEELDKLLPVPEGVEEVPEGTTLSAFLKDFDLAYYVRRARFVATQVDLLYQLDARAKKRLENVDPKLRDAPLSSESQEEFRAGLREIKQAMGAGFRRLRTTARSMPQDKTLNERLKDKDLDTGVLDKVLGVTAPTDEQRGQFAPRLQNVDREYVQHARQLLSDTTNPEATRKLISMLNRIGSCLREHMQRAIKDSDFMSRFREPNTTRFRKLAYDAVLQFYDEFGEFDAAIFPVTYGSDVGELDVVDVIRISPEDATTIVDELRDKVRKLKGTWLAHFGAFLDGRWRASDILWGRLDAVERLIQSLLPNNEEAESLVREAHDAILADVLLETQSKSDGDLLTGAFAVTAGETGGSQS